MTRKPKPDDAPLTKAELSRLRPAREVVPDIVAAYEAGTLRYRGQRGKQKSPTKEMVTLRLDRETLEFFKAKGAGWQTRINAALTAFADVAR